MKDNKTKLSEKLHTRINELNRKKEEMVQDSFYTMAPEAQLSHIAEVNRLREEVTSIKQEIDNLSTEFETLREKYTNATQDGSLWLDDVVNLENPVFSSNNLILSPVGSGKTYFIKNKLAPVGGEYQLLLVPSKHLKNSMAPNERGNKKRKRDGLNVFTTKNKLAFGNGAYKIHVMTYAEFGLRIANNDNFVNDNNITVIYCDEIHSLIEYKTYNNDECLIHALRFLFQKREGITIYYFTATVDSIENLRAINPAKFRDVSVFNYLEYPNIRRYINLSEYKIGHIENIRHYLKAHSGDFKKYGYKGLIYTRTITSQKQIAKILEEEGFTPLVLWSTVTGSKHGEMTAEQTRALSELIDTEKIPEGYNFLVINSAMREGWDLKDEKVEFVAINTTNETDKIQARGRVRKNIATLIIKDSEVSEELDSIEVDTEYLGVSLQKDDKDRLCEVLGLKNEHGRAIKWQGLKSLLEKNGYTITDKKQMVNGIQSRVSIISKK